MNPELFDSLAVSLESLVDSNRRLVALWLRKRTLLAARDLDGLQTVMLSEQELSASVIALEDSIDSLVSRLLGPELRFHRLGRDVLLRRVIALAPEPSRSRLAHFRETLGYARAFPVENRPGPFPQEGFSSAAGRAV